MPRRSRADSAGTRTQIVDTAVSLASTHGLEGLTIGGLADSVGMSKSGLIGHFGTREALQLATLDAAVTRFVAEVWTPVADRPAGLPRLRALCASWLSFLERDVFPGGCFLTAVATEFDDRPDGPVRDAIVRDMQRWLRLLARDAATARDRAELPPDTDPEQMAFELNAVGVAANQAHRLFRRDGVARARTMVDRLLPPDDEGGRP